VGKGNEGGLRGFLAGLTLDSLYYSRIITPMKTTLFWDMYSGGSKKQSFSKLAVELPEKEAIEWFEEKYGNPFFVTCDCCGPDYSVSEFDSLEDLKSYHKDAQIAELG